MSMLVMRFRSASKLSMENTFPSFNNWDSCISVKKSSLMRLS